MKDILVNISIQGATEELNTMAHAAQAAAKLVSDHADGHMKFQHRILAATLLETVNDKIMSVVLSETEVKA